MSPTPSAPRSEGYLAIVNPAAGNGRCGKRAPQALARLRAAGVEVTVRETKAPRDGVAIAREAFAEGWRHFIAAGGDGTSFEVLNGVMPAALASGERVRLGFLPLGTGNAYLREFSRDGADFAIAALTAKRTRPSDVLRLRHAGGEYYFINIFGFGLPVDVTLRATSWKRLGNFSYTLGTLLTVARLRFPSLPMRLDGGELEQGPLTFACVCNSRFTADMMMAPGADIADGLADLIRVAPMGRLELVQAFPSIFKGKHLELAAVSAVQTRAIDFELADEIPVMVDGEVLWLVPQGIDVVHRALDVCA